MKETKHSPYKLEITRWPDDSFNGRPYVTSNGEHVCTGYTNELATQALQYLVERANSAPTLLAENARLRGSLERITNLLGFELVVLADNPPLHEALVEARAALAEGN